MYETEGNIVTITIKKDSLIIEKSEYILDNQIVLDTTSNIRTKYEYESPGALGGKWTEYYSNGNIKAKGQTSDQFACWANVGDFEYYDTNGVLLRVLTYDNWLMNPNDGCHSMIVNMKLIEYYKNGNIKAEKHYQSGYEDFMFSDFYNNSEFEEDYKSGEWKFYDITGKIIKVTKHETRWKKGNT
ncbi:hypothetical protein M4I21_18465 [Cellulophaga sp. 20_2_10]|uniref:hypothetical protein n=1 Tax=Cellulophaga sp. 20_2_10 TaxID=2942476 RepID=UPI00201AEDF5|nr:hypothetical protein [Cellulophaga sp. 20_2_10]MCL5247797.1 hypothetical protein [Cellulophaga sp. 20_2_10]